MTDVTPTSKSAEHAFGAPIMVEINGAEVSMDLIRVQDFIDYTRKVHDDQMSMVLSHLDEIAGSDTDARFKAVATVAGGDATQAFAMMHRPAAMGWLLNRCYRRTHPDDKHDLTQMINPKQMVELFSVLAASSGLIGPNPTEADAAERTKVQGLSETSAD